MRGLPVVLMGEAKRDLPSSARAGVTRCRLLSWPTTPHPPPHVRGLPGLTCAKNCGDCPSSARAGGYPSTANPNSSFTGAQEDAWKTGMQKIEAAGAGTLTPTTAECRAFKNNGGLDAVKATFGGGN